MTDYTQCRQEIAQYTPYLTDDDIAACMRDARIAEQAGPGAVSEYHCMKDTMPSATIIILGALVFVAALFILERFKNSLRFHERHERQSLAALSWNRFIYPVTLFGASWYLLFSLSVEFTASLFCR
jgi:hypothetical protein